jgi:hypothetical protein
MLKLDIIAAAGLALFAAAPALSAKEKAEQPKERKVCRTVEMSGRITPQRICRKVERPAPEVQNERNGGTPPEAGEQSS